MRRAAAVEVRSNGNQHERAPARVTGARDQCVHELRTLVAAAAGREDLLELVDGDHEPAVRLCLGDRLLERLQRMGPGTQQRVFPALASRQHPCGQRSEQSGPQRRRLTAARGTHDPCQRRAGKARDQLGDKALAAREERGVLHVEVRQALVRAHDDVPGRGRHQQRPLVRRLQLDHVRRQVILGLPQDGPLARDAARRGAQPAHGQRAGPRRRGGVKPVRHSTAGREQALDRNLDVLARPDVEPGHRPDPVFVERRQAERRRGAQFVADRGRVGGHQDQHRRGGQRVGELVRNRLAEARGSPAGRRARTASAAAPL